MYANHGIINFDDHAWMSSNSTVQTVRLDTGSPDAHSQAASILDLISLPVIRLLTISLLTTLAEFALVWWAFFPGVGLSLHPNACPFPEPVCDPLNIGVLVKCQVAKSVAVHAALVEHHGIIPIPRIASDSNGYFLAGPTILGTAVVGACELAHHMG